MAITNLPRNPAPSFYLDGMELGVGIDAITGEVTKGAVDKGFKVKDVPSTGSKDSFSFRSTNDVSELESNDAIGFSGSVTFPVDGLKVGAKNSFDFSNSSKSSTLVLFIVFDWERNGNSKRVDGTKLSADALTTLKNNKDKFRKKFGDYFVYQLSHRIKFTAIW